MRLCPHCKRLNPGRPDRCHYCGRTWHLRLCPWGHPNPCDAVFCGRCGSADLSRPAPSGWTPLILKAAFTLLGIAFTVQSFIGLINQPGGLGALLEVILITFMPLVFLLLGMQFLFTFAPVPRLLRGMPRRVGRAAWGLLGKRKSRGWRKKKPGGDLSDLWAFPPYRGNTPRNTGGRQHPIP